MTTKRIVCTDQLPVGASPRCARILDVGISDGGESATERLRVHEVVERLNQGWWFYVRGAITGAVSYVEKYWCPSCCVYHIRSHADATVDNNLDSLRYCSWQKAA